jgi:hypothetical protein
MLDTDIWVFTKTVLPVLEGGGVKLPDGWFDAIRKEWCDTKHKRQVAILRGTYGDVPVEINISGWVDGRDLDIEVYFIGGLQVWWYMTASMLDGGECHTVRFRLMDQLLTKGVYV